MGSQRGIAMIWWVIVLLVLFLAASGYAYDRYAAHEEKVKEVAQYKEKLKERDRDVQDELQKRLQISEVVGFGDGGNESQPSGISAAITRYKEVFADPARDAADGTLEALLSRAEQRINLVSRQLADSEAALKQARLNEDQTQATAKTNLEGKDAALGQLQSEKQTVETNLSNTTRTKDQEIESYRTRISTKDDEIVKLQKDFKEKLRVLQQDRDRLAAQVKEASVVYTSKVKNDGPDGMVASRVTGGSAVFIDVGSRQGLKAGTQFEVFEYAKGNIPTLKGQIVIQEVQPTYARAAIVSEVDRYTPIAKGDLIRNPLFERNKSPRFYLLGDMTGRWSNQQTAAMINDMGGQVVDSVDPSVDFVVIGRRESDSAIPFENRPEWERIQNFNLEIIDSKYLAKYFGK